MRPSGLGDKLDSLAVALFVGALLAVFLSLAAWAVVGIWRAIL